MAVVKSIEIDIGVRNVEQSKAKLDEINRRADALKDAFPEYKVKIETAAAKERLDVFRGQVKAVADEAKKPMDLVVLNDRAKAKLREVEDEAKLLRARFPHFTVRIDDAEAKRKLALFAAETRGVTDEINRRIGGAGGGGGGGLLGKLGGLLGGGGGGGGGISSLASGGLTSPAGLAALGTGGTLAAALLPSLLGLGIGGGVGALGIGGSLAAASYLNAQVKKAQAALKAAQAKGAPAGALPAARANLAEAQQMAAPFAGLTSSLGGLGETALMTFARAVGPLLKPLPGIFADLGRQVRSLGPLMTQMFSASLPFVRMFAGLMTQSAKILLPAFTQAMNQMVKSGALTLMSQALVILVKGLAGFITALGPGMRSSAMIFRDVAVIIGATLRALGLAMAWLANAMENVFHSSRLYIHYISRDFDGFRHGTANVFDGLRHDIAHIWDVLWDNTTGRAIRAVHDIEHWLDDGRHWIRQVFGTDLAGFFTKTLPGWWDSAVRFLHTRFITPVQDGLRNLWGWVWTDFGAKISTFLTRTLPGWFGSAVSGISRLFGGIKNAIGGPVHWVGQHVLDPLDSFINKILSFVGIRASLPTGLAAGGRITAGTGPTADDVLIRASRGETVVSAAHSAVLAPLFSAVGVPGYAKGGHVGQNPPMPGGHGGGVPAGPHGGTAGGTIGGFLSKAADVAKIAGDLLAGNAGAAGRALAALAGHGTGGAGGQLATTLGALPGLLIKDIVKAIISKAGGSGSSIVSYAMQWLGKIPYVWGGTSVPGGADCSGFTQAVYGHFGIQAPRTSEQQYAWARHSGAVPGALAFYVSAAGGPPPGHVAIVRDGSMVISQGGGMGPQLMPVNAMPLMGFGVPPGGFGRAVAGGVTGGSMSAGQVASVWMSVGGPARAASNMARIAFAESGDVPSIVQQGQPPGLTGWGLWQITPTSGIWQNGAFGNLLNASNNARAALSLYRASGYLPWASDPVASSLIAQGISYDRGGWLMPGLTLAYNGTGRPEPVGGGNTYVINVTLPPGSDREHGRRIVGYIRAFEKGSGSGWRK